MGRINIEGNINNVLIDANPASTEEEIEQPVKQKRKQSPVQVHIQLKDHQQVVVQKDLFAGMGQDEKSKGKKLYSSMHKNKID